MQPVTPPTSIEEPPAPGKKTWVQKLGILVFVVVCFEVGLFLLLFPWMDGWDRTSIPVMVPLLAHLWDNAFFRGAISGIGAVNIYISLLEIGRLRRVP